MSEKPSKNEELERKMKEIEKLGEEIVAHASILISGGNTEVIKALKEANKILRKKLKETKERTKLMEKVSKEAS